MKLKQPDELKEKVRENFQFIVDPVVEFLKGVCNFMVEFLDNSNVHGVRYFTERRLHWSERAWWMSFFCVSVWLCITFIGSTWDQWNDNPVTLSFTEKERPISVIPFPTVTICPETKTSKLKFDVTEQLNDMLESKSNLSKYDTLRLDALSHICSLMPDLFNFYTRTDLDDFIGEQIFDIIREMAPTFNETMDQCWWQSKVDNCTRLIEPVFTEEGLCFTFNSLNSHDIYTEYMAPGMMIVKRSLNQSHWNPESGYDDGSMDTEFPIRVVDSGRSAAFEISLKLDDFDFEYQCRGYDQGFKVILTPPGEALRMSRMSFRVPVSEDTLITIKPKMTITSHGLRSYNPNLRQCVFLEERSLHFFRIYTQNNCNDECLANFTKIQCGCVKFSMPRDKNTPICGGAKIKCYKEAEKNLSTSRFARAFRDNCNCLQTCTTIEYQGDIDRVKFDMATMNKTDLPEFSNQKARLAIFFHDQQVETIKRIEVYTYSDFLAVCGGLMGLFLGMSVLSLIELIYYGTLRWYWAARREREQNAIQQMENQKIISVIPINRYN